MSRRSAAQTGVSFSTDGLEPSKIIRSFEFLFLREFGHHASDSALMFTSNLPIHSVSNPNATGALWT